MIGIERNLIGHPQRHKVVRSELQPLPPPSRPAPPPRSQAPAGLPRLYSVVPRKGNDFNYKIEPLANGEQAIINYTTRLPYYVVHGLFDRALLQVGTGSDAQRVTITRQ